MKKNVIVNEFAGDKCINCAQQACCQKSIDSFEFMHFLHANLPEMQFQTQSMGAAMQLSEGAGSEAAGTEARQIPWDSQLLIHTAVSIGTVQTTTISSGIFPNQKHPGMILYLALKPIHRYFTICVFKGMQIISKDRMAK